MCRAAEQVVATIKKNQEEIYSKNIKLDAAKLDAAVYNRTQEDVSKRLLVLEANYDETFDRTRSLENWVDVYLPLRLQH